jgi:hypothetical protein
MKLKVVAKVAVKAHQEDIKDTHHRILKSNPDGSFILQFRQDQPELWVPGENKSYQIVINGVPCDFGGVVDFGDWKKERPVWVNEAEDLPIEDDKVAVAKLRARKKS